MQLLELNKKEMIQIKAELFTVKKDYEKLDSEQQKQGVGFQKYKTLAKVAQDKSKKLGQTVDDVKEWVTSFKDQVNFEDASTVVSESPSAASSFAQSQDLDVTNVHTCVRNLEQILISNDQSQKPN